MILIRDGLFISMMVSKDNQEGFINQCFYFDKTSNKRLYIATANYLKKAHL